MKRSVRLARIQRLLCQNTDGLTSYELAEACGVHVRTIQRDLLDLQSGLGVPLTQAGDRYAILGSYPLPPVSFSSYEVVAIFLACRLAMRQSGMGVCHVSRALGKILEALPATLARHLYSGIDNSATGGMSPGISLIFESVAAAWLGHRQMKIRNISLLDNQEREWLFEPYFMEMAGVGHSIYVMGRGRRDNLDRILSVRIDRITYVEVLETGFEPPSPADMEALLSFAWKGMWEDEAQVRLWLSHNASNAKKARHSVVKITNPSNDGCVMTLHVAGWLEAHPSATSWAGDMELLSPASVRKHFVEYAEKLWQISPPLQKERARMGESQAAELGLITSGR